MLKLQGKNTLVEISSEINHLDMFLGTYDVKLQQSLKQQLMIILKSLVKIFIIWILLIHTFLSNSFL